MSFCTEDKNLVENTTVFSAGFSNYNEEKFINREFSWLQFNFRVLSEAQNLQTPFLERFRFLAISAKNLEEYFKIRIAKHVGQALTNEQGNIFEKKKDQKHLLVLFKKINLFQDAQQRISLSLLKKLEEKCTNIKYACLEDMKGSDQERIKEYFFTKIFSLMSVSLLENLKPLKELSADKYYFIYHVFHETEKRENWLLFSVPMRIKTFLIFENPLRGYLIFSLKNILDFFIIENYYAYKIMGVAHFRIIRDGQIFVKPQKNLYKTYEDVLWQKKRGRLITLEISKTSAAYICKEIEKNLGQIPYVRRCVDFHIILQNFDIFYNILKAPEFKYLSHSPAYLLPFGDKKFDYFTLLKNQDILLHHPYESFQPVIDFLNQAAEDKDVFSIQITLYRTEKHSALIKALLKAAKEGKDVTVIIELRARFDEQKNILQAYILQKSGIKVFFGLKNYKTHAKLLLIKRKEKDGVFCYAHFGTGNYHAETAKIYTDFSLFIANPKITQELSEIFDFICQKTKQKPTSFLGYAPFNLREKILNHIERESRNAALKLPAFIYMKMNALTDKEIIEALYRASQNGVIIFLSVRGVCALRPQVKNLSENITVLSLIGRFLEHSRIFYFSNGGQFPNNNAAIYLSSADMMKRNLDHRIEILIPLLNKDVRQKIISVIKLNIMDTKCSYKLMGSKYSKKKRKQQLTQTKNSRKQQNFDAQSLFMDQALQNYKK